MKIIARVTISDVALIPWSATEIGTGRSKSWRKFRFVKKNPFLEIFQAHVKRMAKAVMGVKAAYDGPCYLDLYMVKKTEKEELWGTWCYVPLGGAKNLRGDLTNLIKSIEDGLEGVVFADDQLVCAGRQMIVWGASDSVQAKVFQLETVFLPVFHPTP